jgi:hypothetical protein
VGSVEYRVDLLEVASEITAHSWEYWLSSTFEVSREKWIEQLRRIGLVENILVEIPVTSSPPSPWDGVWQALAEARDAFEKGGTTGWKSCIVACRLALEEWQKIENADMGPGWNRPPIQDLQQRTKAQRIDNIRWHLMQVAHYSAHSHADKWEREDAILLLATLSALLARRQS